MACQPFLFVSAKFPPASPGRRCPKDISRINDRATGRSGKACPPGSPSLRHGHWPTPNRCQSGVRRLWVRSSCTTNDRAVAFWRTTGWLAQSNGVRGYYVWRVESRAGVGGSHGPVTATVTGLGRRCDSPGTRVHLARHCQCRRLPLLDPVTTVSAPSERYSGGRPYRASPEGAAETASPCPLRAGRGVGDNPQIPSHGALLHR